MIHLRRYGIGAMILIYCLGSLCCRKQANSDDIEPATFNSIYKQFWSNINTGYVYWDRDPTKWSEIYSTYLPLFSNLNLNSEADCRQSVRYFREMTTRLVDGHFYIDFEHAAIRDSAISPSLDRWTQDPHFRNPIPFVSVVKNYLDTGWIEGIDQENTDGVPQYVLTGMIGGQIAYFNCNKFAISESLQRNPDGPVARVVNKFLSVLQQSSTRGIIFDLRNNQGGNISDLLFFLQRMLPPSTTIGYTRYKRGPGPLEYTPWIESHTIGTVSDSSFQSPIVVLGDHYTASSSEIMILAIQSASKGSFVGERTWGATGLVAAHDLYNAGTFTIPGFATITMSSAAFMDSHQIVHEAIGVPPDYEVPATLTQFLSGTDGQLVKAIQVCLE